MTDETNSWGSKDQNTQRPLSSGEKGKTMRNLYRYLAVAVLTIGMAACQTDAVRADAPLQPPASAPDGRPPGLPNPEELPEVGTEIELAAQQLSTCYYSGVFYGYNWCFKQNMNTWWLIWPYGHGFRDCYYQVILYDNGAHWSPWLVSDSWNVCNQ